MNLQEQTDRFLRSKTSQGKSPHTIDFYFRNIADFMKWCDLNSYEGQDLVGQTGAEIIEDYQNELLERGLSPFTIHCRYRALRALYKWVEKRDGPFPEGSPFHWLTEPKTPDTLPKAISYEEVTLLLHSIQPTGWVNTRDRLIIKTLFHTGMRAGELLGLRVNDIQTEQRRIHLYRTKTQKEDYIPLSRSLARDFNAWLTAVRPDVDHDWLWPSARTPTTTAAQLMQEGLKQMLRRRCKGAGIKIYRPHSFRHGCAVHIVQRNGDVSLVKELLGHADLTTTQVYLRFNIDQLTSAYDKIFD